METFNSWALSAVAASTVAGVISLLAPSGNFEKTIKIVITLFILVSFVMPFVRSGSVSGVFESNEGIKEFIEENELNNEVKSQVEDSLENVIVTQVEAFLSSSGVIFNYVEAKVNVDEANNVFVKSITIYAEDFFETEEAEKFIIDNFGIKPDIVFESEDQS